MISFSFDGEKIRRKLNSDDELCNKLDLFH
jgi:hypothetical protein